MGVNANEEDAEEADALGMDAKLDQEKTPLRHQGENCWNHCGKEGNCTWCGVGKVCCRHSYGHHSNVATECKAENVDESQYTKKLEYQCVSPLVKGHVIPRGAK